MRTVRGMLHRPGRPRAREFSRCRHEKASKKGACSIYGKRPESCREFKCLWLADPQHLLDRKDRPDRTGIVFATADMTDRQVVVAFVRKPGADASGRGKELIDKLATMIPVCIIRWDGTRSIALPENQAGSIDRLRAEFNAQGVVWVVYRVNSAYESAAVTCHVSQPALLSSSASSSQGCG